MLENSLKFAPASVPMYYNYNYVDNRNYVNVNYDMSQHQQNPVKVQPDIEFIEEVCPVNAEDYCRRNTLALPPKHHAEDARSNWMNPKRVVELYYDILTPFERNEIFSYSKVYFIGSKAVGKKIPGTYSMESNYGYDDAEGGYIHVSHDHVAYRYEVLRVLGKGSFGQVLKVYNHKSKQYAALKIVRNKKRFLQQAKREVKILELLAADPANTANVVHIKNSNGGQWRRLGCQYRCGKSDAPACQEDKTSVHASRIQVHEEDGLQCKTEKACRGL